MTPVRSDVLRDAAELLEAGGMRFLHDRADRAMSTVAKYNPLADPEGAEQLGAALSTRLHDLQANVVVVWEEPEDAVLGYIVARQLGLPAVRTWNADGLVSHAGRVPKLARAVIVTDAIRDMTSVRAIVAFIEQQGGEVLAAGTLVKSEAETHAPVDVRTVAILELDE